MDRIRDREIDRQDCTQEAIRGWIESEIDRQAGLHTGGKQRVDRIRDRETDR